MAKEKDIKFGHGPKERMQAAVDAGTFDKNDFLLASDTNDEMFFVDKDLKIHPLKARTDEDYVLNTRNIGALKAGFTIPAGSSIDDVLKMLRDWILDNEDELIADIEKLRNCECGGSGQGQPVDLDKIQKMIDKSIAEVVNNAPYNLDTLKEIADWIKQHQDSFEELREILERLEALEPRVDNIEDIIENEIQPQIQQNVDDIAELQEIVKEIHVEVIDYDAIFAEEDVNNG